MNTRSAEYRESRFSVAGAAGRELLLCLKRRRFPLSLRRLFASTRLAGRRLPFAGDPFLRGAALNAIQIAELLLDRGGAATSAHGASAPVSTFAC